ncbi:MAG: acyl-CoA thioesterase [Lentisphaerae bacterium]|nr:acyl-CoA thioesterase [Lentisphaerota bacterium]
MPTDKIFRHTVRVPYAQVDIMGFVYYANYFIYFEMARAEMMREAGLPYTELEKQGVMLPVVEAFCAYKSPAHFDDLLHIATRCTEIKGTRLRIEYEITRDGALLVTGHTVHVCVSPQGKVLRPHPDLRRLFMGE